MKGAILIHVIAFFFSSVVHASVTVIDLSASHSLADVLESGLKVEEINGGPGERDFAFQHQEVAVRLPGGRIIQQRVELGIIDSKDDSVTKLSMSGGVMPEEQAFQVSKMFLQSFGLPTTELDQWNAQDSSKKLEGGSFGFTTGWAYYPRVSLSINRGVNRLYPWVVRCKLEWGRKEQRDWNEERVARELPPPEIAVISLNPPSGRIYNRRDAYKEALEEQARLEKELAAKGQAPVSAVTPRATPPSATSLSSPVVQSKPPESSSWTWIIAAILSLGVLGGIVLKLLRK